MFSRSVRNGASITNAGTTQSTRAAPTGKPMLSATEYVYKPPETGYSGAGLTFPTDLISSDGARDFYISMGFVKYSRRSVFEAGRVMFTDGIRLPIPNNLVDTSAVIYSEQEMGVGMGLAVEAASQYGAAAGALGAVAGGALADTALKKILASGGSAAYTQQGLDYALQQGGLAMNPFLNLMFRAPAFKTHTFNWKLSPSNQTESETLRRIIAVIKKNMYPSLGGDVAGFQNLGITGGIAGSMVLSYPSLALIKLFPKDEYLYEFKPCVVTSMSINFTPSGTPAFFNSTKAPAEVSISISLKEIEYWLSRDINPEYQP